MALSAKSITKNVKYVFNTIYKSSYIRAILIFFTIILLINLILLFTGHLGSDKTELSFIDKIIECFYYTSTQFSTIGYGDISPVTPFGKVVTSGMHVIVIFITLRLASEFGIMPMVDEDAVNQSNVERRKGIEETELAQQLYKRQRDSQIQIRRNDSDGNSASEKPIDKFKNASTAIKKANMLPPVILKKSLPNSKIAPDDLNRSTRI